MSDSAKLTFVFEDAGPKPESPLAVQIRDAGLTVRAAGLSNQALEVPPDPREVGPENVSVRRNRLVLVEVAEHAL